MIRKFFRLLLKAIKFFVLSLIALIIILAALPESKEKKVEDKYTAIKGLDRSKPCEIVEGIEELKEIDPSAYKEEMDSLLSANESTCAEERAEALRMAELNKMGLWSLGNYVDEFGDRTGDRFLSLSSVGTFSNTATTDSLLTVEMLYDLRKEPKIVLYEYGSEPPVIGVHSNTYYNNLRCKGKIEEQTFNFNLKQAHGADRFTFPDGWGASKSEKKALSIFRETIEAEGFAQVICEPWERPTTQYKFSMSFAFYQNALRKLNES